MAVDFSQITVQTDRTLKALGLYETITYIDPQDASATYNPITGEYEGAEPITYTFPAVVVTEDSTIQSNDASSGSSQQLIAIPSNINFTITAGQLFCFDGFDWIVESFSRAPQNTIVTIVVRRK